MDELIKGDDAIIKHLEDSTNVVKSNQKLTVSTILWIIFYGALLIVDNFFYKIPRIGGLWPNIFVMVLSFIGILWYVFDHAKVLKDVDSYKKKKGLYLTLFILIYIVSIFISFHLIGLIVTKSWLHIILRGTFALVLYLLVNGGYELSVKRIN